MALGLRAAFSLAIMDNGRLLGRSEACEVGLRCCQDKVGVLDGIAFEGEALTDPILLGLRSTVSGSTVLLGVLSLVGDLAPVNLSIASSMVCSRVELREGGRWSDICDISALGESTKESLALLLAKLE